MNKYLVNSMKIAVIFILFGFLWIFYTDTLFYRLSGKNMNLFLSFQHIKGVVFVLLAGVLIFFVSRHLNRSLYDAHKTLERSNTALKEMHELALYQKGLRQKEIAEIILHTQEAERKRLAEELHDNINQLLAATKLYLDHGLANPEVIMEFVQKGIDNILYTIQEIRKLSRNLMPPVFEDTGLAEALRDMIRNITESGEIEIVFHADVLREEEIEKDIKIGIYRIVQEQLNNILRHAHASEVQISLRRLKDFIELNIRDDGKGFDMQQVDFGLGLHNIRNRSELCGGQMELKSEPGKGCALRVIMEG